MAEGESVSISPAYQGEVQLAGWVESHTGGAKVTFWLPDASALDAFRGMTAKRGNRAGHRMMCVLVEIGDDEHPVEQERQTEKPKGGPLAQLAGRWCADPFFRHWYGAIDADEAAHMMRIECHVDSRAELDHDEFAAQLFHRHIREPFRLHCREAGVEL